MWIQSRCLAALGGSLAVVLWATLAWPAEDDVAEVSPPLKSRPACIAIWLKGGPPTIDMWDLKDRNSSYGTPFSPIATAGGMEICEHFPQLAKVMDRLSVIRSISCRGEVEARGEHYMQTCFVPNPNVEHPSVGSVIARELSKQRPELTLPAYVSLGGSVTGSGYLEPRFAPLVVGERREFLRQLNLAVAEEVLDQPLHLLEALDAGFDFEREVPARTYRAVKAETLNLVRSHQLQVFDLDEEDPALRLAYGSNEFGQRLLLARRLVEAGVPFVDVTLSGWDVRADYFDVLRDDLFPTLDTGLSTLVRDLDSRGLLAETVVVVAGGYARAPSVRHGTRDHWSRSLSVVAGGGGLGGGQVIGRTNASGRGIETPHLTPGDLWATVGRALGISLETVYQTRGGRSVKIFNSGRPIEALLPE